MPRKNLPEHVRRREALAQQDRERELEKLLRVLRREWYTAQREADDS